LLTGDGAIPQRTPGSGTISRSVGGSKVKVFEITNNRIKLANFGWRSYCVAASQGF
jgi:hypothetical protein